MSSKRIFTMLCMIAVITVSLISAACKKSQLTDTETQTVTDNINAEGISQEIQNLAEQAHSLGLAGNFGMRISNDAGILSACTIVKNDSTNTFTIPDTMVINFGTTPCVCHDGRYRQGKILVYYTGKYRNGGATINIYFSNYAVGPTASDLYQIENSSTKNITNNGINSNGLMNWTISTSLKIVKPNSGGTITFTENKTRAQTAGNPDIMTVANKYDISGSSSGTASNGSGFSAQTATSNDLIKDMSCNKLFVQGELDVTPTGSSMIAVTFGTDGTCDNTATATRGGHSTSIMLR